MIMPQQTSTESNQEGGCNGDHKDCAIAYETTGDDLSDEIWLKIIQYNHSNSLDRKSSVSGQYSTSALEMFRHLPYVSRTMRKVCNDFVRIVPLDISSGVIGNPKELPMIQWMCQTRVKIGKFDANSYHDINSMWLRIIVHILISCNTAEMSCFDMKCDFSLEGVKQLGKRVDAENAGMFEALQHSEFLNEYEHQALLADTLFEQAPCLKSLSIMVGNNSFHLPLLERFLDTIEELELYAYAGGDFDSYHYNEQDDISGIIGSMKNLKKLFLGGELCGSLTIISESLEKIDIRGMTKHSDFIIECCICPSLKMFSCTWDSEHGKCIGLEPVAKLDESDLHFDDNSRADIVVEYRPFHGMMVPGSCIVSLLHRRFLL